MNSLKTLLKYLNTQIISCKISNKKFLFALFCILYIIVHFLILKFAFHPTAWFDEVMFADIARNFAQNYSFHCDILPQNQTFPLGLYYGPNYFILTGLLIKYLSFDYSSFRIPGILFGFFIIIIFYYFIKNIKHNNLKIFLLITFALDYSLIESMHLGRMETTAVFFALMAIYFFIKKKNNTQLIYPVLVGVFAFLACITTPRVGITLVAIPIIQIIRLLKSKNTKFLKTALITDFIFALLIIIYILLVFKSLNNLIFTFQNIPKTQPSSPFLLNGFSFNNYIYVYQYPIFFSLLILVAYGLYKFRSLILSEILIYSIITLVVFYNVVYVRRPYAMLVLPFFYLGISDIMNTVYEYSGTQHNFFSKYVKHIPKILLFIYGIAFLLKLTYIFSTSSERNNKNFEKYISTVIPQNSRVIGDEMYYYAVAKTNSSFQFMHIFNESDSLREKFQREKFDYDYMIVSTDFLAKSNSRLVHLYATNSTLYKIGEYLVPRTFLSSKLYEWRPNLVFAYNYNCIIFKRVKPKT